MCLFTCFSPEPSLQKLQDVLISIIINDLTRSSNTLQRTIMGVYIKMFKKIILRKGLQRCIVCFNLMWEHSVLGKCHHPCYINMPNMHVKQMWHFLIWKTSRCSQTSQDTFKHLGQCPNTDRNQALLSLLWAIRPTIPFFLMGKQHFSVHNPITIKRLGKKEIDWQITFSFYAQ